MKEDAYATDVNQAGAHAGHKTGLCWMTLRAPVRTWVHVDCGSPSAAKLLTARLNQRPYEEAFALMDRAQAKRAYFRLYEDELAGHGRTDLPLHATPTEIAQMLISQSRRKRLLCEGSGRVELAGVYLGCSTKEAITWLANHSTTALHLFIRLLRSYRAQSLQAFLLQRHPELQNVPKQALGTPRKHAEQRDEIALPTWGSR